MLAFLPKKYKIRNFPVENSIGEDFLYYIWDIEKPSEIDTFTVKHFVHFIYYIFCFWRFLECWNTVDLNYILYLSYEFDLKSKQEIKRDKQE